MRMSVLDELRDASVAQALETFDTMWWLIRRQLDACLCSIEGRRLRLKTPIPTPDVQSSLLRYLDAADDHTRAMSHAVEALRSCSTRI